MPPARMITFADETLSVAAWAARVGLTRSALESRLRRWPLDRALTAPAQWRRTNFSDAVQAYLAAQEDSS